MGYFLQLISPGPLCMTKNCRDEIYWKPIIGLNFAYNYNNNNIVHAINSLFQALVDSDPEASIVCVFWDFDDKIE